MIVVDAPIVVCTSFPTVFTDRVLALHAHDPVWEAPLLWRHEYLKVLALFLKKGIIHPEQAEEGMETASYFIGGREHVVSPFSVLQLLNKSRCSAEACEFIAVAQKLSAKLITYNHQILRDFPHIAIKPEDYIAQKK